MTSEPKRFRLRVELPQPVPPVDAAFRRHPGTGDAAELGALIWAAYRGTPDESDVGDSPAQAVEEIGRVFDATYGPPLLDASYVVEHEGRLVAGALVTVWKDEPLLAYLFTAPEHVGKGLGKRLVQAAMAAIGELGHSSLNLAVTEDNVGARRLYERLGFLQL